MGVKIILHQSDFDCFRVRGRNLLHEMGILFFGSLLIDCQQSMAQVRSDRPHYYTRPMLAVGVILFGYLARLGSDAFDHIPNQKAPGPPFRFVGW